MQVLQGFDNRDCIFELPASVPVLIDDGKCNGCNLCVNTCQVDIFLPNRVLGGPPSSFTPENAGIVVVASQYVLLKEQLNYNIP